jgi:NADPH:quinone reductase-like Zn-dependent oxidoreductase
MLPLFEPHQERGAVLRPVLERTYPMTQLADAHRVLEGNATFGKIVVTW